MAIDTVIGQRGPRPGEVGAGSTTKPGTAAGSSGRRPLRPVVDRWLPTEEELEAERELAAFRPLTKAQAVALRAEDPSVSPWRVVGVQAAVGVGLALLAALVTGRQGIGWSALYGAAVVVLPGALMARGMTSKLSSASPGASAVGFMFWEMVKIGVSVLMLIQAPKLVQHLSWPALLVGLVVCIKVYWFSLLWRGRKRSFRANAI